MESFIYIILALAGFFVFMQVFVRVTSHLKKGKQIKGITGELGQKIQSGQRMLLYFFSPGCGACKTVTPIIDSLKKEHSNIHKIDVSKEPEITQSFGIMGTPATIVVENSKIAQYILGAKSESFLRKLVN